MRDTAAAYGLTFSRPSISWVAPAGDLHVANPASFSAVAMLTKKALSEPEGSILHPSLPFHLLGSQLPEEIVSITLVAQLDSLNRLATETHSQLQVIREQSAEILRILSPLPSLRADFLPRSNTSVDDAHQPRVYLFGTFTVGAANRPLTTWVSRKARLLFAYLAMQPKRLVPRDVLIDLFWPDSSLTRGSNNLSIAIHQIRNWLKEVIPTDSRGLSVRQGLYGLDAAAAWWVDVEEFETHLAAARLAVAAGDEEATRQHLSAAVDLYGGDLLESDPYEEWTAEPRRNYGESYRSALAWLARDAAELRDWERVANWAKSLVRRDSCDEEGHRWLMMAYQQSGRRNQALLQYKACAERLLEELGVGPSEETQDLYRSLND